MIFLHFWSMLSAFESWSALPQSFCRVRGIWTSLGYAEQCLKPTLLHTAYSSNSCTTHAIKKEPLWRDGASKKGVYASLLRRKVLKSARDEKCGWEVRRLGGLKCSPSIHSRSPARGWIRHPGLISCSCNMLRYLWPQILLGYEWMQ